jgi:hypothetical protein
MTGPHSDRQSDSPQTARFGLVRDVFSGPGQALIVTWGLCGWLLPGGQHGGTELLGWSALGHEGAGPDLPSQVA